MPGAHVSAGVAVAVGSGVALGVGVADGTVVAVAVGVAEGPLSEPSQPGAIDKKRASNSGTGIDVLRMRRPLRWSLGLRQGLRHGTRTMSRAKSLTLPAWSRQRAVSIVSPR